MEDFFISILKCISIYFLILICLRVLGKKSVSEYSPTDLIFIILIGSTFGQQLPEEAKYTGALVSIACIAMIAYFLNWIVYKNKTLRKIVLGEPVILVRNGRIIKKHLEMENLSVENIMEACRSNGLNDIKDVELAILEIDGKISIIK